MAVRIKRTKSQEQFVAWAREGHKKIVYVI